MGRVYLFLAVLFLGACGFEPAGKARGDNEALNGQVHFAAPKNPDEFHLRGFFDDTFDHPTHALYFVDYTLDITENKNPLSTSTTTFLFVYTGKLNVTITDRENNLVKKFSAENTVSQSSSDSIFSKRAERENAAKRLARALGALASARIIATINATAKK